MNSVSGVIAPSDGDIYYFETLAELDEYIEYEDMGQARSAKSRASLITIAWLAACALVFFTLKGTGWSLLGLLLVPLAWIVYNLVELLELCDD